MANLPTLLTMNKNTISSDRPKHRGKLLGLLTIVIVGVLVTTNWRAISDTARLHNYQPPAAVAALATDTTMNTSARRVFYVNHPAIDEKKKFAGECPSGTEQTVVLGCYHSDQQGIFVLSVDDSRLNGIEQVTAAHETLHAEYDRLSSRDKAKVDGWLTDYYEHGLKDQDIKAVIDSYKKTEPTQLVNEMHSIFGTEVANLPPNLETYYKRYFTDRAKIVSYYTQYQAAFSSRKAAIAAYDAQLSTLKTQITTDEADLQTKQLELTNQRAALEQARDNNRIAAYNAGVPGYNRLVDDYNTEVATVHDLVAQYNQIVKQRNAIVLEEQQLSEAISSTVSPISKQ